MAVEGGGEELLRRPLWFERAAGSLSPNGGFGAGRVAIAPGAKSARTAGSLRALGPYATTVAVARSEAVRRVPPPRASASSGPKREEAFGDAPVRRERARVAPGQARFQLVRSICYLGFHRCIAYATKPDPETHRRPCIRFLLFAGRGFPWRWRGSRWFEALTIRARGPPFTRRGGRSAGVGDRGRTRGGADGDHRRGSAPPLAKLPIDSPARLPVGVLAVDLRIAVVYAKAILRASGLKALHDEEAIYEAEVRGPRHQRQGSIPSTGTPSPSRSKGGLPSKVSKLRSSSSRSAVRNTNVGNRERSAPPPRSSWS